MPNIAESAILRGIASTSAALIVAADADDRIRWVSPSVEHLLGTRPEQAVGRPAAELLRSRTAQVRATHLRQVLAQGESASYVDTCTRADGRVVDVEAVIGPVEETPGEIVGTVTTLTEAHADLAVHRALQSALVRARADLEQAPSPLAVVGLDETVVSVNQAWCELFDAVPADFVGRPVLDLVHPLTLTSAERQVRRLRREHTDSTSLELVLRGPHGTTHPLVVEAVALRDGAGEVYAVGVSARDVAVDPEVEDRVRGQGKLARALGRRSWEGVFVTDETLRVEYVAPTAEAVLGQPREALLGRSVWALLHPAELPVAGPLLERVVAEPGHTEHLTARMRDRDGGWRWIEQAATNCMADPDIGGVVWDVRDLTEEIESEQALRYSETLHRAIVENVQEGILATAEDGTTILANDRLGELTGLPLSELYGRDVRALLGRHYEEGQSELADAHRDSYEKLYATPDRGGLVLSVTRSPLRTADPEDPEVLGALYVVADVTDARSAEAELRRQALHDPLTGLPNRYLLIDRIGMAQARSERTEAPSTAMLFVDLDAFKSVNDRFGHQAGDEVLVEVARRLKSSVRGSDTVARLGGDEFAILCEETGELGAQLVADRIQDAMLRPVVTAGEVGHDVRLSIGISVSPPVGFGDLLRLADDAMYDAKQNGGGHTGLSPLIG